MRAGVTGGRAVTLLAAAALLAALLVGCGSGGGLDVAAVQRAVTREASVAYPTLGVGVTRCGGAGGQAQFRCTVHTATVPLHVAVRTTRNGRLALDALDAVFPNVAAAYLVRANASISALVGCGTGPVTVAAPGATLPCTVAFADGTSETVQVRVLDAAGDARIETPGAPALPPAVTPGGGVSWSP
ncbi:MAG TPA: hypothetical protein VI462_12385, partial [Acidimicrobiia bacterium]